MIQPLPVGALWLLDLQHQAPNPVLPNIPATFQQVGSETASALAETMGFGDPAPVLERFSGTRRCYVGWVNGVLATYGWVSFNEEWVGELELRVRLAPDEAYIWDCATLQSYRGQGLYPALLAHIAGLLQAEGLHRIWIGADTGSVPSQKGITRAGFHPIADFYADPALPERYYTVGRPGVPEDLVHAAHNVLLSG